MPGAIPRSEPGDPKPIIYLGGLPDLKKVPGLTDILRFACLSYFYQKRAEEMIPIFRQRGIRVFLDSGAFTYLMCSQKSGVVLNQQEADRPLPKYAKWVLESGFQFDFCATFDYVREPVEVLRVTKKLETLGLSAIPVYHSGTPIIALHQYADAGYRFILISKGVHLKTWGNTRPFLDQVFNVTEKLGIKTHGLACTGPEIISYPWYSVDSARWSKCAMYGWLLEPWRGWIRQRAVTSRRSTLPRQALIEDPAELMRLNAMTFINLGKQARTISTKRSLF